MLERRARRAAGRVRRRRRRRGAAVRAGTCALVTSRRWRRRSAVDVVLPAAARPLRRRRHGAGTARAGGLPYVGAGVLGSAVAMDKIMMKRDVRGGRAARCARYLAFRDGHDVDDVRRRGRGRARAPVLREAVEHGLVGRRVEGARPRGARRRDRARARSSTSGCSPRSASPGGRSRSACSATTRPRRRCPARWSRRPTSTTTPTSTKTGRPSCSCPRR